MKPAGTDLHATDRADARWRAALLGAWALVLLVLLLEAAAGLPALWQDRLPSWGFQARHSLGLARLDGAHPAVPVHAAEPREAARLQAGDQLRFPQVAERWLVPRVGSERSVQRLRDGRVETLTLRAEARPFTASERFDYLCRMLQALPTLLFSLLLALKRPLLAQPRRLCLVFLAYSLLPLLNFSFSQALAPLVFKQLSFLALLFANYQLMRYAVEQLRALPGTGQGWERLRWPLRLLGLTAGLALLAYLNGLAIPALGGLLQACLAALQGVTLVALLLGHGRASGALRLRLRFLLAAMVLGVLPVSLLMLAGPQSPGFEPGPLQPPMLLLFGSFLLSLTGLGIGVLRHRVFDVYLTGTRLLVYALALLAITAVVFGLKHLAGLPLLAWYQGLGNGHEKRVLEVVGVFTAYLAGHFSFHWLDARVQRLVFHRRHQRAAALRQFLQEAQHIAGQEALLRGLHQQLDRFSEQAGNAIYLRLTSGEHARVFSSLDAAPPLLEGADPACAPPGVRMLPMGQRGLQGSLGGLVLLGERRNGEPYDGDELDLLHEAVEQVALDLQAIAAARWNPEPGGFDPP